MRIGSIETQAVLVPLTMLTAFSTLHINGREYAIVFRRAAHFAHDS
jgi:hypothetical protein